MRIGISCYATLGGSGAVATELGKALAERGHEVHFIVTGIPFRLGLFQDNIYVHEVETATYPVLRNSPLDLAMAAKMADVVAQFNLEVLHVHYALPYAVCAFLAKEILGSAHPVRIMTTLHGTDITVLGQDPLLRDIIRLGIEKSDIVTAVSQSLITQTNELFSPQCPIQMVHNFVDLSVYYRREMSALRARVAPNGEKILMHMSNFRAVKRIQDVIAVFCEVRKKIPAKLLLVGEGPDLDLARRLCEKDCLSQDVLFLGKRDEVAELLSLGDLLLLPSEKESFGLVALESMACGVPVVGSNAGGIPEVVEDGVSGFLAEVGDVEAMSRCAIKLLSDDELWLQFSRAARERAKRFSINEKVAEYEALYTRLVQYTLTPCL